MVSMRNSREIKGYVQQRSLKCQSTIGNEPKRLSSEDGAHCHVWMVFPLPPVARFFFHLLMNSCFVLPPHGWEGGVASPKDVAFRSTRTSGGLEHFSFRIVFVFKQPWSIDLQDHNFYEQHLLFHNLNLNTFQTTVFHQIWFWDVFALEGVLPWRGSCASATSSIRHLTHFS